MVTYIPNVQNWTVAPQNGQPSYFTLMNTWLGQSTLVIASLQTSITAQNKANSEINTLAIQTENNAIVANGLANFQGTWSNSIAYSKGQSVEYPSGSKIYYTSKVDNNLNRSVTDTNYWLYNPINDKVNKTGDETISGNKNFTGNLLMTGSSSIIGYGTGSGGAVTQATSKSTAVTLNKPTGQITMNNAALAAGASVYFTLNNNLILATDVPKITLSGGATDSTKYSISDSFCRNNSFDIKITNTSAGSLSEALVIQYAIIKGATA